MLETIFSWLTGAVSDALSFFIRIFLQMLEVDSATFLQIFPALKTGYQVFQAMAVGLIVLISALTLLRFSLPLSGQPVRDTPLMVLLKAGLAGMLVYFGGYPVSWFVELAKIPYDIFTDLMKDAVRLPDLAEWNLGSAITENLSAVDAASAVYGGSAAAVTLISLVMLLVIAFNLIKLMLEVLERYLMVAVLEFLSPLAFSALCSGETEPVFRRWMSMFFGQCLLLGLSVFSLDVCLSGLQYSNAAETGAVFWLRLLLVFAMIKISLRLDTYLQQLGLTVGTTGQNLLGDLAAGVQTFRRRPARSGGNSGPDGGPASRKGILGSLAGAASAGSNAGGLYGGLVNARRQAAARGTWDPGRGVRENLTAGGRKETAARLRDVMRGMVPGVQSRDGYPEEPEFGQAVPGEDLGRAVSEGFPEPSQVGAVLLPRSVPGKDAEREPQPVLDSMARRQGFRMEPSGAVVHDSPFAMERFLAANYHSGYLAATAGQVSPEAARMTLFDPARNLYPGKPDADGYPLGDAVGGILMAKAFGEAESRPADMLPDGRFDTVFAANAVDSRGDYAGRVLRACYRDTQGHRQGAEYIDEDRYRGLSARQQAAYRMVETGQYGTAYLRQIPAEQVDLRSPINRLEAIGGANYRTDPAGDRFRPVARDFEAEQLAMYRTGPVQNPPPAGYRKDPASDGRAGHSAGGVSAAAPGNPAAEEPGSRTPQRRDPDRPGKGK